MKAKKDEQAKSKAEVRSFSKEQLTASRKYECYRDFLTGNLKDGQMYSTDEVDALIEENYKKGIGE